MAASILRQQQPWLLDALKGSMMDVPMREKHYAQITYVHATPAAPSGAGTGADRQGAASFHDVSISDRAHHMRARLVVSGDTRPLSGHVVCVDSFAIRLCDVVRADGDGPHFYLDVDTWKVAGNTRTQTIDDPQPLMLSADAQRRLIARVKHAAFTHPHSAAARASAAQQLQMKQCLTIPPHARRALDAITDPADWGGQPAPRAADEARAAARAGCAGAGHASPGSGHDSARRPCAAAPGSGCVSLSVSAGTPIPLSAAVGACAQDGVYFEHELELERAPAGSAPLASLSPALASRAGDDDAESAQAAPRAKRPAPEPNAGRGIDDDAEEDARERVLVKATPACPTPGRDPCPSPDAPAETPSVEAAPGVEAALSPDARGSAGHPPSAKRPRLPDPERECPASFLRMLCANLPAPPHHVVVVGPAASPPTADPAPPHEHAAASESPERQWWGAVDNADCSPPSPAHADEDAHRGAGSRLSHDTPTMALGARASVPSVPGVPSGHQAACPISFLLKLGIQRVRPC